MDGNDWFYSLPSILFKWMAGNKTNHFRIFVTVWFRQTFLSLLTSLYVAYYEHTANYVYMVSDQGVR